MNRLLLLLCILGFSVSAKAQLLPPNQPEQDACNALVMCGTNFTFPYSYQGIGLVPDLTNTPCSGGEGNSMWIRLNINTGGVVVFTINPIDINDDYDFAVMDITNSSCSTISSANVIRCNFNNNMPVFNNGILGLNTTSTTLFTPAGATGGSYLQQINALPGEVYLIMINNFGVGTGGNSPTSGFTIDFTGTTATFNGPSPTMISLTPICNGAKQAILTMSENIRCTSIEPNGSDFSVSGVGTVANITGLNCIGNQGYTDKLLIDFGQPLPAGNYTLNALAGTDGNTLLNLCDHPLLQPASLPFTVSPYSIPTYAAIEQPACSEIRIKMAALVRCDGIAKNGSDFSISGPQSANIIGAYGLGCDTNNLTDTVVLLLQYPLQTDGVYTITAKNGTDNNTLVDSCGLPQPVGDDISMTINSYDGQLISASDTVVCGTEFIQLGAINNSPLPPAPVTCGLATTPCGGNVRGAYIGGRDTMVTTNSPFFGGMEDQRAQYLYLASELREMGLKPGSITTLQWKITQQFSTTPYQNLNIRIGCTPLASLGTSYSTGLQDVFTTASYVPVTGWNSFNMSAPFNWDGTSNLVVEVCFDNIFPTQTDEVAHSVTPFVSVLRRSAFGASGCAITTQGSVGGFRNMRPKLRFFICEPPAGIAPFVWSPGTLLSDSTIQNPLAFIDGNKTYHITTVDKYGCAHRDSMSVILSVRNAGLTPGDTTICFGDRVMLTASGGVNYDWVTSDPTTLSCLTCPATEAIPKVSSIYQVIIRDQYNCADTLQTAINVNALPIVTVAPNDTTVKYGTTIQLNAGGGRFYTWYPAGYLSDPNIVSPVATITEPITFILYGIDENGCRNVDSIRIGVDYNDVVFIPTAFSPNGDGRNDRFKVGSLSFQRLTEFRIFNRWGQEIFATTDRNQGWDGSFRGQNQDPGVYHYIIRLAYPDGKVETYKGDVTLVR